MYYFIGFASIECAPLGQLMDLNRKCSQDNNWGLYVIPEPVKYCGKLVSIEANGFYIDIKQNDTKDFGFIVRLFRPLCDGSFRMFHREPFIHRRENSATYGYGIQELEVKVMRNDRIGVQILPQCRNSTCPFQPTVRATSSSQVLYNQRQNLNSLETRTDIFLNVQASIGNV